MGKYFVHVSVVLCLLLIAGTAAADSIKGRLGVTGRLGFVVPSNSDVGWYDDVETDLGFHGGGGLIYGVGDNLGLEFEATHHWFDADGGLEFSTTGISLGVQYRFNTPSLGKLVPYVGGGLDLLLSDATDAFGENADVDTVPGAHANGGIDYFITKQLALNADVKVVVAPDADIKFLGVKVGDFDPTSLATTVGFRYFFN